MKGHACQGISGLVVEYIVAIDVTRVRFPADALFQCPTCLSETLQEETLFPMNTSMCKMEGCEVGGKWIKWPDGCSEFDEVTHTQSLQHGMPKELHRQKVGALSVGQVTPMQTRRAEVCE